MKISVEIKGQRKVGEQNKQWLQVDKSQLDKSNSIQTLANGIRDDQGPALLKHSHKEQVYNLKHISLR